MGKGDNSKKNDKKNKKVKKEVKKPDAKKLQAAKLTADNERVQGAPMLTSVLASVPRDDDDKPDPDPPKNHGKPKLTRIK
jgi:hypothetical protein